MQGATATVVTLAFVASSLMPVSAATAGVLLHEPQAASSAAADAAAPRVADVPLTTTGLIEVAARAVDVWPETEQAGLAELRLLVTELPGDALAITTSAGIAIDLDAAGHGWFVDATPYDDEEFHRGADGRVQAVPNGPAAGRMDLASVLAHEIGHVLGRAELDFSSEPGVRPVMADHLDVGERRLELGYDAGADPDVAVALAAGGGFHIRAASAVGDVPPEASTDAVPADAEPTDQGESEPAGEVFPAEHVSADPEPAPAEDALAEPMLTEPTSAEPAPVHPEPADQELSDPTPAGTEDAQTELDGTGAQVADEPEHPESTLEHDATGPQSAEETPGETEERPITTTPALWQVVIDPATGTGTVHFADDGSVTFGDTIRRVAELSGIVATGTDGDDTLTVSTESATTVTVHVWFDGRGGSDTLIGPQRDAAWIVTGTATGLLKAGALEIAFAGVEHLVGAPETWDRFVLEGVGWVESVDGGGGGFDTLELAGGTFDEIAATVTGAQSGVIARDDLVTVYDGLEPVEFTAANCTVCVLNVSDTTASVLVHTVGGNTVVELTDADGAPSGETHTYRIPTAFTLRIVGGAADTRFSVDALSTLVGLYIDGGDGDNTIVVLRNADFALGAPSFTSSAFGLPAAGFADLNPTTLRIGTQFIHLIRVFFAELTGGAGDNTFTIGANWAGTAVIDGGEGADTLIGPDADTDWVLADGHGALDWGIHDADDTLVATGVAEFTGIEALQGG